MGLKSGIQDPGFGKNLSRILESTALDPLPYWLNDSVWINNSHVLPSLYHVCAGKVCFITV
jgi:hypothetical protein